MSEQKNVGKLSADKGGLTVNQVTYRLSGSSVMSFDMNEAMSSFQQTVEDAHLSGTAFKLEGTSGSSGNNRKS